ncbi:D-glycero-alpha-D-manno-heptose-1,7-bisphosphate 7-phosphatase [Streptomyces sp. NPDC057474]|uniref:D-glycero-alpha-D-manno-heptose-1,7-bisphosphate 7-phosphatase n=1 Tax=Streptomyces sp. NPDC057474 TaxID=3346144 RepID=UPI0036895D90
MPREPGPLVVSGPVHLNLNRGPRGLLLCDRDGTIIRNRDDYVLSTEDVEFLPGATSALRRAHEAGLAVVLVSNQSPVGRGLLDAEECLRIHRHVTDALQAGGAPVTASYLCPHAPADDCVCRKPRPGLALAALKRFGAPTHRAWLVGDSREDMGAAVGARVRGVLVRTGRGARHEPDVRADRALTGVRIEDDLAAAVQLAVSDGARAHPEPSNSVHLPPVSDLEV